VPQSILSEASTTANHLQAYLKDTANQKRKIWSIIATLKHLLQEEPEGQSNTELLLALQKQCQALLVT